MHYIYTKDWRGDIKKLNNITKVGVDFLYLISIFNHLI